MNQRTGKLAAESIMNRWTATEMGEHRAKKLHKKAIKKQRRTLEKREAVRTISEFHRHL